MRGSTPVSAINENGLELAEPLAEPLARRLSQTMGRLGRLARRQPLGACGLLIVAVLILIAIFAPWIAPYNSTAADPTAMRESPSASHFFGTDQMGRDVFSRVIMGARLSVGVSFTVVAISAAISTILGIIAGYYQRWPDYLLQRMGEFFSAFPPLVFLLLVVSVLHPSVKTLVIALTLPVAFAGGSRVIRGASISIKQNQYIEAARAMGASDARIIFLHILPNVMPLTIVGATTGLGAVILALSALGYLGLGVPPPTADWGGDLSGQARTYFRLAPWLAIFPGVAISLTVLAFNLLGDSLRDLLDPRLRGSR
jgi:peptide/nickel transport system permease protein